MSDIDAQMVKRLRQATGAGMMDCKSALREANGDTDAAIELLRIKGLGRAERKSDRPAAEGLVGLAVSETRGALIEVNSETDFVARNDVFQKIVSDICALALVRDEPFETIEDAELPGTGKRAADHLKEMVGVLGENLKIRRCAGIAVSSGVVAGYVHGRVSEGLGRIGVLVALESDGDRDRLSELGRMLAMHVAATDPLAATIEDLDPHLLDRERALLRAEAEGSGKPDAIVERMVEGRLQKFFAENVLVSQTSVIDGETPIADLLTLTGADVGCEVRISGFLRFELGRDADANRRSSCE